MDFVVDIGLAVVLGVASTRFGWVPLLCGFHLVLRVDLVGDKLWLVLLFPGFRFIMDLFVELWGRNVGCRKRVKMNWN